MLKNTKYIEYLKNTVGSKYNVCYSDKLKIVNN